jgi:hypothetical protein
MSICSVSTWSTYPPGRVTSRFWLLERLAQSRHLMVEAVVGSPAAFAPELLEQQVA